MWWPERATNNKIGSGGESTESLDLEAALTDAGE
jgi:hypothetical protein